MDTLPRPYEIFDIGHEEAVQVRVMSCEEGTMEIHPGYGQEIKVVEGLRIHLAHPWSEGRMPYIDITSQRLKAMLLPELRNMGPEGKLIRITKYGVAPKATFSVAVIQRGA